MLINFKSLGTSDIMEKTSKVFCYYDEVLTEAIRAVINDK